MNTAVTTQYVMSQGRGAGWFATLVSGVRWGIEMRRRYDIEVAAGRRPDEHAMRRITGEVDAWLGRPA